MSLLPEAEIVFRVAAETHPGGAHAAIVAELDRLRELETGIPARLRDAWQDGYTTGFSDQTELTERTER